jgi:hypothetical protein
MKRNATALQNPQQVLKEDVIDFVVIGEGEETLVELVKNLDNKEEKNENKKALQKDFENWVKGKFFGFETLLSRLLYLNTIDLASRSKYQQLYSKLSIHIHTIRETPIGRIIRNRTKESYPCSASAYFKEEDFKLWLEAFQIVISVMIERLLYFFPDIPKKKDGRYGIGWIQQFYDLDKEFRSNIIVCEDFRKMISTLPKIDMSEFGIPAGTINKLKRNKI